MTSTRNIRFGRLLRLARFLRTVPERKFKFCTVAESDNICGTVACAIGWTPSIWPNLVKWTRARYEDINGKVRYPVTGVEYIGPGISTMECEDDVNDFGAIAVKLFGLREDEANALFAPSDGLGPWQEKSTGDFATNADVAESIERFVAWRQEKPNARLVFRYKYALAGD